MKYSLIFLSFLLTVSCYESKKEAKSKTLLSFDDIIEVFNSDDNGKDKILKSKGFLLIRDDKTANVKDYSKIDTICQGEGIFIENKLSMTYYLNGTQHKRHYESIKKEIETRGFVYTSTTRKKSGVFAELYVDSVTNKRASIFSVLPPLSAENACDVEGYRIRFARQE